MPEFESTISQIDYLIGWICILPSEYNEAIKMFDEIYDSSNIVQGHNDKNSYDVGRIGNHLVVMNCPAAGTYGQIRAAKIASDMKSTFPAIRFMLLVGIGGGSPYKQDVRLGDVVLGTKVVPYTQGRQGDRGFLITGSTKTPPPILQTAITRLGSRLVQGLDLQKAIEDLGSQTIPRPTKDNLYRKDYVHGSGCDCLKVEAEAFASISSRHAREKKNRVQMHQGVVGSGDQVMKNVDHRDQYAGWLDIICYEMEAIGVMETTSCLTVRGISDYSDGHKNDEWHPYASLSAAVCAKELLKLISAQSLGLCALEVTQEEIERSVRGAIEEVNFSMNRHSEPQKEYRTAERNLNTIVDRYGLLQHMIAPGLQKLVEQSGPRDSSDEELWTRVVALETLQRALEESLDTINTNVRKQAKSRDTSDAMRQNWKNLKRDVDRKARWVSDVSKITRKIIGAGASSSRRFFLMVGRKGGRTFHDAGKSIQHQSRIALEHLKHLMEGFNHRFRLNKKEPPSQPSLEATPSERTASCEDVTSEMPDSEPELRPPFYHGLPTLSPPPSQENLERSLDNSISKGESSNNLTIDQCVGSSIFTAATKANTTSDTTKERKLARSTPYTPGLRRWKHIFTLIFYQANAIS
ncbi:uncharacterized protein N7483_000878 [Penicillium malachiteum]|uniref:uncharacterized protein n=1 Tax=Penicillium malachiteum TaxID=1324776 RepID=UPI002547E251|nr:uncharacterized protein N7483_000878 [Penicillium malachiteum]KAJ5735753.1 hypothetical protein N7483_000878 [Penicillium malachiteum]